MEPNQSQSQTVQPQLSKKTSAKDFFLNLGAIVALFTTVISLVNLLFTVINKAFPQITNSYGYYGSQSISFPVATLVIFFPIFILLMWVLEKGYVFEPIKKQIAVRRWLTYITLFIAGLTLAGDLVTVLYYFLDGQELTTGFILKVLTILVLAGMVFWYYISDIREKLTSSSHRVWFYASCLVIFASIIWGFIVLGSPRTQQLLKYDEQKVNDLQVMRSEIMNFYSTKGFLPKDLQELSSSNYYNALGYNDKQTNKSYAYEKDTDLTYKICAEFNRETTPDKNKYNYTYVTSVSEWSHPAGYYCFDQKVQVNNYAPTQKPLYPTIIGY